MRVVRGRRGASLTMTFAVSVSEGLLHHELHSRGMTCARFNEFLSAIMTRLPEDDQSTKTIIFDNASAHRQAQNVTCPPNVNIKWLPPYSPFLNVVENCFSQWKANIKRDLADVRESIISSPHDQAMETLAQIAEQSAFVRAQDAAAYFRHLQTYLPACMTPL